MASRAPAIAVFAVAFALRLLVPLTGGGLVGNYSYDAGVYYSAGAALVRGRPLYRDFILLHPPGIAAALAPAAWIGRLTSDHVGFALAVVQFTALGAASAVLVVVVARGLGAGRRAATAGGLFYAVWFLSVRAEYVNRLEPLGNFLLLCGLAAYVRIGREHTRRWAILCGVALGGAAAVKIWYAAPLLVVLGFLVARDRVRDAGWVSLGAVGAAALICGPFFVLAPESMWRMVVSQQLGREAANPFRALVFLQHLPAGLSWQAAFLLDAVLVVVIGLLLRMAWRAPMVRLPTALLLTGAAVLLSAPSWFLFYVDYLTPAAALCVAVGATAVAAAHRQTGWSSRPVYATAGGLIVALLVVTPAKALWYGGSTTSVSPASKQLASAVSNKRCVMSDSPMALVRLNALDRNLANGCSQWGDVTGRTYASDMDVRGPDGRRVPRHANPRWQEALREYLLSGDAVIVKRPRDAGIAPATWDAIRGGGVLAADGSDVVYGVPSPSTPERP